MTVHFSKLGHGTICFLQVRSLKDLPCTEIVQNGFVSIEIKGFKERLPLQNTTSRGIAYLQVGQIVMISPEEMGWCLSLN